MSKFRERMELRADRSQSRRFARVPFEVPVRLTRNSTGQTLELAASNLSEGGLFLETVIPLIPGELFRLTFPSQPGELESIAAARVTWRRAFSPSRLPGEPPGAGLSFLFMSAEDRQALRALVESGGVAAPRPPARAPVAPRLLEPVQPTPLSSLVEPSETLSMMDVGPFGWLLVVALAMAAVASLLLSMQPVH